VLNALAVLQPSTELSALVNVLFGIEERTKLYYISGGKTGGGPSSATSRPVIKASARPLVACKARTSRRCFPR